MNFESFSLLYPNKQTRDARFSGKDAPDIPMFVLDELGLTNILELKSGELSDFFTMDPDVIAYRLDTFADMMNNPALPRMLKKLIPVLSDVMELRRLEADSGNTEDYLSSLTEIELYISSIEILHEGLCEARDRLKGQAFCSLAQRIQELTESDYYRELNQKLSELTARVREIKSVTIGVNLDAQLRPTHAGVLSVNPEPFRSGDVLEKILRLDFKDSEYTCIAELVPFGKKQSENQKMALSLAFHSAINDVYCSSLRSWKRIVQSYVLDNTDFLLTLLPEFEFLTKGNEMLLALQSKGCPLCRPEVRPLSERAFDAKGLYNPDVALRIEDDVVLNDLVFDDKATVYVLTGPNRGGKSVITCAIGLALVMMQLGMFVPAQAATLSPADAIFTHFPTGAEDTIDKGRLGEECARLGEIFDTVTAHSLVLLDESLSSTGSYEASYIAAEVISGLSLVGCRALFSTHLHELAAELDGIAARTKGAPIDTLVAGIEGEGKRSFKITRAKPDGKSYARDIANRYGLTYDNIVKKVKK